MERNTIEIEVTGGEKAGFKCGTLAIAIACREADAKSVNELLVMLATQDLKANLALLYGAYCQFSGKKFPEFTMGMMSDLTEKMTDEQSIQVAEVLLERFKPKNVPAPPGAK